MPQEANNIIFEGIILLLLMIIFILKIQMDKFKPKNKITEFAKLYDLTEKETEILEQLLKGLTSKAIADIFFTSEHTIKKHRSNIHRKCEVTNSIELFRKVLNT